MLQQGMIKKSMLLARICGKQHGLNAINLLRMRLFLDVFLAILYIYATFAVVAETRAIECVSA